MEEKKRGLKWFYWFSLGVAIILVYKLLDNLGKITNWIGGIIDILMPFVIGIIIAYLLYIPCKKVEDSLKTSKKWISKKARTLSVFIVYIITILIIIIALLFVIPAISKSIVDFVTNFGYYYNNTLESINRLPDDSFLKSDIVINLIDNIKNIDLNQLINFENITQYAKGAINVVNGVFDVFVSLVVSIYLLVQRSRIVNFFKRLGNAILKNDTYKFIGKYFNKSNEVFFKFISGQVLDALIVGIFTSIAMSILGVRYAILLGFMIGLFNLIPYFGAIVAVIIAVIITIFTGGLGQATLMAVVVIIIQQIDSNIINPRIIGNSLSISPLLVIFAVTVGGAYFGVLGMFLAVPAFTVIKLLIEEYIEYKNNKKIINFE